MSKFMTIGALALLLSPVAVVGQEAGQADQVTLGAEVWATNCTRCHTARPSTERTDAQWLVIVNHMRARANLTKTQARLATLFLQETNLPPDAPAVAVGSEEEEDEETRPTEASSEKEKEAVKTGGDRVSGVASEMLLRLQDYLRELREDPPSSTH